MNVGFIRVFQHSSFFLRKSICCEPNVSIETVATQCGIRILRSLRYATWTYLHHDRYLNTSIDRVDVKIHAETFSLGETSRSNTSKSSNKVENKTSIYIYTVRQINDRTYVAICKNSLRCHLVVRSPVANTCCRNIPSLDDR